MTLNQEPTEDEIAQAWTNHCLSVGIFSERLNAIFNDECVEISSRVITLINLMANYLACLGPEVDERTIEMLRAKIIEYRGRKEKGNEA